MPSLEVFSQVSNLHSQAFDAFKANEACQGSSPSFDVPHREGSNCVGPHMMSAQKFPTVPTHQASNYVPHIPTHPTKLIEINIKSQPTR